MKTEPIILEWKEKGEYHKKEIDRQKFFNLMESIKNTFSDDNQISSVFVEIIPNLVSITIDKDRNEDVEVPWIYYQEENQKTKELRIRRNYHKIIWSMLDYFCK